MNCNSWFVLCVLILSLTEMYAYLAGCLAMGCSGFMDCNYCTLMGIELVSRHLILCSQKTFNFLISSNTGEQQNYHLVFHMDTCKHSMGP